MTLLTFIIPVRHQDNSSNWARLKENLAQTISSISAQTSSDWRAVIVANEGADLPNLPERFEVERVHFPPNVLHERQNSSAEDFMDAFRFDKGRRVLKGMLSAADSRYFMIVDDDDLVSADLASFVGEHAGANGWYIRQGWLWTDGGSLMMRTDRFNKLCGTCLIVRSDLYALPARFEDADPQFIMRLLGSHSGVATHFEELGTPLESLPFKGAVYRVGYSGSHSGTAGVLRKCFDTRNPMVLIERLRKLKYVSPSVRREFFGG
ncbi:MAG: glycosyltransferase family 2 protein [Alphaproteobacteria bacterium]|nr:MAG: glycosyltransferase family 2 protein [Alphaproteobacteria bacterium]